MRNWQIQLQIVGLHLQDQRVLFPINSQDTESLHELAQGNWQSQEKEKKSLDFTEFLWKMQIGKS